MDGIATTISLNELAQLTEIPERTLYRWVMAGLLVCERGPTNWRASAEDYVCAIVLRGLRGLGVCMADATRIMDTLNAVSFHRLDGEAIITPYAVLFVRTRVDVFASDYPKVRVIKLAPLVARFHFMLERAREQGHPTPSAAAEPACCQQPLQPSPESERPPPGAQTTSGSCPAAS